ncbi:LPS export ABC transporter periplasmic protein LptC [Proteobacteria bacterium 005FR1]|nr:LPS export ABC transporter periplasmic protein LptC [Proteobacteria bacterium 005FR1]
MPRHWLTIIVSIALFATAIVLLNSPPQVLQQTEPPGNGRELLLSGYLTGVRTTQYGEAGAVEYRFSADRMSHFQADREGPSARDYTDIEAPSFTFYQAESAPWRMTARQGRSSDDGELVILQDDVRVWQNNTASEPTVITTSELLIRPESQVAETDQFVMITRPQMVASGVGMRADLEQETFAIRSEGKTVYEPNR